MSQKTAQKEMNRRLVVIDGNSLINRAYYAIQRPMITKEGLYTQAVYGFLNILQKIRRDYEPGYMVVAFDRKAPTFRHLEYEDYKAGRKKMPPELAMQLPLLKEVLDAMNIRILEIDGFEADDIIGTVARRAEEEDYETLIITGDKDALQLATHVTKVIITKKGISEFEVYDYDAMMEKYGFSPEQFIDFKGLMGDSSDNIPGLPGVGEKTAQKLVLEYGSVANLISNTNQITNAKLKEKVEDNIQLAIMSRRLAEINTQVPIEIQLEDYVEEEPEYDKLIELYKRLEFNSFLKKLQIPEDSNQYKVSQSSTEIKVPPITIIKNAQEFTDLKNGLKDGDLVAMKIFSDNNHIGTPILTGATLSTEAQCYYIDLSAQDLPEELKSLIYGTKLRYVGHYLQEDYYALFSSGLEDWEPETAFDTAIAQYLLQPGRRSYDLNALTLEYFHQELAGPEASIVQEEQLGFLEQPQIDYPGYGARWCATLFALRSAMYERLSKEGLLPVFEEIELPLISPLAHMEVQGFAMDRNELIRAGHTLTEQIAEISARVFSMAGEEFNINSPRQLGEILFEKLGLPSGKKNKTGYSTNAEILERLRGDHEIVDQILEYRTLSKLNSTYVEGLLPMLHDDGKIHAHFQQTVAATGRISCTEPNLQNIPIKQEVGRRLRKAFIPESDDYILVGADYSQIELRVLAHLSEDPTLIEAFREGADIHRTTAAKVFEVPESEVTSLQRSNAKAVNFGVIYGMSSFGLSTELNISRKMAESYIDEYFKKYANVKSFMDRQVEECKKNGYVTTIMNRKRPIPEINASNYMQRQAGERLAMNSPIQGSAADIIKIAMVRCHKQLLAEGLRSRLILQVHDELIIQAHREELDRVKIILCENMENALELKVPLSVDLNTGENWYELK